MESFALSTLITPAPPLPREAPMLSAYEAFSNDPNLYAIAVVDPEGRPVGLLNRFKFLEALSRPFAHELFRNHTVEAVMDRSPLIVDEHTPVDEVSARLVADGERYIFDGFVVARHGGDLGIGTGYSVMRYLADR